MARNSITTQRGEGVNPLRVRQLAQEIEWRLKARESIVEYAQSIPIPGVPQDDNHDELKIVEEIERRLEECTTDKERRNVFRYDDGRFNNKQYIPKIKLELAEHHRLILNTCQAVIEGTLKAPDGKSCRRTMLFFPPGSAKSTYGSVVVPTWCMGKYPENPIILTSYADMLAKKHGKRARQVCMSPEYQAIWETTMDPKTQAADQWALLNGSEYLSAGLQSGLTGNRAFGLIWDDPVKGRRAAESLAEQVATWDAYKDDARSRKIPDAWEIGIMTRWHERDLAGMILPEDWNGESGFIKGRDGNWWYVLCVQAMVETETDPLGRKMGEYLWTDWFQIDGDPEAYWAPFKLDSRSWGSLYQQIPTPPEGTMFKDKWVQYYDRLPALDTLKLFLSADYAVTRAEDADNPDMTSIGVWGIDPDDRIYFIDGWHGQVDAGEWTEIVIDFMENYDLMGHIAGGGPIRRGTEPMLRRRMDQRSALCRLIWYPETFNKEENARAFQALMQLGQVYWPTNNEEAVWIIRHLVGFGTLRFDDAVDMCSMMGRHVHRMWAQRKVEKVEEKPIITGEPIPVVDLMPPAMRKQVARRGKIA